MAHTTARSQEATAPPLIFSQQASMTHACLILKITSFISE